MTQHTKPCAGCPWRKKSLNGWLGSSSPERFLTCGQSEERMPCHLEVNYNKDDWELQANTGLQCAGRAAFWANQGKIPYNKYLLVVKPNSSVFSTAAEFLKHHGQKFMPKKLKKIVKKILDYGKLPEDRIEAEIHKLKIIKPLIRRFDLFGADHWKDIDAQIQVLEERMSYDEVEDFGFSQHAEEEALRAVEFLENEDAEPLVDKDGWESLIL